MKEIGSLIDPIEFDIEEVGEFQYAIKMGKA